MHTAHKAIVATLATAVLSVGFFAVYALALYATGTASTAYADRLCPVGQCGTEGGALWIRVDGSQSGLCNGFNYAPVSDPAEAEWRSTDVGGIDVIDNCFLPGPGVISTLPPTNPPVVNPNTGCVLSLTKTANVSSTGIGGLIEFTINIKNTGGAKCTGSGVWIQDQLAQNVTYISETHSPNITGGYDVRLPTLNTDTEPHVELNPYKAATRTLEWNAYVLDPGETAWAKVVVTAGQLYAPSCGFQITNKARATSLQYANFSQWAESNVATVDVPCAPVPPPSGPTCDLNLTAGNINWSTTGGNQVLISPLTNSPQIPGLSGGTPTSVTHGEGDAYTTPVFTDITQNGGTTLPGPGIGFAADQATMNRVCAVLHGPGSTASTFGARRYDSPGNNSVVRYSPVSSSWSTIGARSYNSHLSSSFTCVTSGGLQSYPFSGSHNFVPPLGTGTHTYRLTVNGPNGSTQCTETITVGSSVGCKLEITKSVDAPEASPGDTIEYTINFKNVGDRDCTGGGVKLIDVVDPGLTFTDEEHSTNVDEGYGSYGNYTASDRTLRWNAHTLTPGESGWVRWDAKANTPSACIVTIPNIAKITSAEYNNFQTWVSSNRVNVEVDKNCPPPASNFRIHATKIVCDNEADLPNWGAGGPDITSTTVSSFLAGHPSCRVAPDWTFEWANAGTPNPGNQSSTGGSSWTAFGPTNSTGVATTDVNVSSCSSNDKIWVREQFKSGHIPFSGSSSNVSAEMYCSKDVLNYDNYDSINNPKAGQTYYCVAWNVPVNSSPQPSCTFTADKDTIAPNEPVTFDWSSTNATEGKWMPGGANAGTSGHFVNTTITSSGTYTIKFTGPGGEVSCSETITVTTTDLCPNIDGVQTSVPQGKQLVNGQCVDIPPSPACTLTASANVINSGESVKISWTSSNATAGTISGNVGNATPVAAGTSIDIFPPDDTTFTGTFTGPNGTATCTVFVDVRTGGGGCIGSTCPGGLNPPTVTLASLKNPGPAPLVASVYLSQVPYTGFEAGPALTMIFWTAIALLSALIAYFIVGRGGVRYVLAYVSDLAGVPSLKGVQDEEQELVDARGNTYGVAYPEVEPVERSGSQYAESVMAAPAPAFTPAPVMPTPASMPAMAAPTPIPSPTLPTMRETSIPPLTGVIESRAHAAGVLISPEAVAAAAKLSPDRAEALVIFGDILNKAIQTIPRDDGWVMLTSDRFETVQDAVMAKRAENGLKAPASFNVDPIEEGATTTSVLATATGSAAAEFVGAILGGDRDTAFGIVRSLEKDHISPTSLMTGTAAVLDRIYRLRKGGKNGVDAVLLEKAGTLDDATISRLVEIFAHSLDQAYANPFTGVKLALAQAFETLA